MWLRRKKNSMIFRTYVDSFVLDEETIGFRRRVVKMALTIGISLFVYSIALDKLMEWKLNLETRRMLQLLLGLRLEAQERRIPVIFAKESALRWRTFLDEKSEACESASSEGSSNMTLRAGAEGILDSRAEWTAYMMSKGEPDGAAIKEITQICFHPIKGIMVEGSIPEGEIHIAADMREERSRVNVNPGRRESKLNRIVLVADSNKIFVW